MTINSQENSPLLPLDTERPPETTLELLLHEIGQPYTEEHRQLERTVQNIQELIRIIELVEELNRHMPRETWYQLRYGNNT